MYMTRTIGVAEVYQRGIDQDVFLTLLQQVLQVAEVPETASHPVPRTVLVKNEHLAGSEPTLQQDRT